MLVDRVERLPIEHRVHRASATGTIQITDESGTREATFAIEAESEDDVAWDRPTRGKATRDSTRTHHNLSEPQARDLLHAKLLSEIRTLTGEVLVARQATYVAQAEASLAQGDGLAAEHALYIANEIVKAAGLTSAELERRMATTYAVPAPVLAAALAGQPFPTSKLDGDAVAQTPIRYFSTDSAVQEFRSILTLTLTGGVSSATPTGDTSSIGGGIASFAVNVMGFGFRLNGGLDGNGTGVIDFDFLASYGAWIGWLSIAPVVGFGMDTTTGNQDRLPPSPGAFRLPVAFYVEYGLRVSYAFQRFAKAEVLYTNTARTSSALAEAKRLDLRAVLGKVAITARYAEYLYDLDGVFAPFGADGRAATSLWLLGGIGF